jgi:hypothetical protein
MNTLRQCYKRRQLKGDLSECRQESCLIKSVLIIIALESTQMPLDVAQLSMS